MLRRIMFVLAALALLAGTLAVAQTPKPAARVGVYDSRAIVIAYMRGEAYRQFMQPIRDEYEKAKAANDQKRVQEIEAQMRSAQALAHQQGFSTASVMSILDKIKDQLPVVAKEAGVSMIVSKWELAYRDPAVEYVDVTLPLVKLFNPDAKTLANIDQLKSIAPVPLEKLAGEMHH